MNDDYMNDDQPLTSWLKGLVGKQISTIEWSVFVPADPNGIPTLLEIAIAAEGQQNGKVTLSSDGESIAYDDADLCAGGVGEYGKIEKDFPIPSTDWSSIVGYVVTRAYLLVKDHFVAGLVLRLSDHSSFFILNVGDQLVVSLDPNHFLLEEGTSYREVS